MQHNLFFEKLNRTKFLNLELKSVEFSVWCNDGASKENLHVDDQNKQVAFFFYIE